MIGCNHSKPYPVRNRARIQTQVGPTQACPLTSMFSYYILPYLRLLLGLKILPMYNPAEKIKAKIKITLSSVFQFSMRWYTQLLAHNETQRRKAEQERVIPGESRSQCEQRHVSTQARDGSQNDEWNRVCEGTESTQTTPCTLLTSEIPLPPDR